MAAVYSRGDIRAFSIGALVPWVSRWTNLPIGESLVGVLESTVRLLVIAGICGAVAVSTRRWIDRDSGR